MKDFTPPLKTDEFEVIKATNFYHQVTAMVINKLVYTKMERRKLIKFIV